ncbi:10437_t:CDS:1 [Dentiscutata heterogama]|uniref:10437_t:CDS:1 n=1 Tax=Dentiscutata heterogama TaxID=1316150 RepID=A0ACA9N389_9GLOM|nr:10437_t:CDS:1 [Dentiscutata heterogama]
MIQRKVIKRQEIETTSSIGTSSVGTSFIRASSVPTYSQEATQPTPPVIQLLPTLQASQTDKGPIPIAVISTPPGIITPYITMTVTDKVIPTPTTSNAADLNASSPQAIILAASVLCSVGLITILGVVILCWFRKGERSKSERNEVSQIHDDEVILRRSRRDNFDGSIDQSDDFVTYRPSDPDDEQLPSYAEAIVIGRASLQSGQYGQYGQYGQH